MVSVFADNLSEEATPTHSQQTNEPEIITQDADLEFQNPIAPAQTAFQPSNMLTLDSIKRFDEEMRDVQGEGDPSQIIKQRHDKMDDMISEAAVSVINAMTKMINNHQRRRSHVGEEDIGEQEDELSDRNREILQKILVTASMLLSEDSGSSGPDSSAPQKSTSTAPNKEEWIQCEYFPQETRLRCGMEYDSWFLSNTFHRKHLKRHERPYGCTFLKCDKSFSSKVNWKRHEQSQYFQSCQCTLPAPAQGHQLCALIYNQEDANAKHLSQRHQADREEVQTLVCKNRLGGSGVPQF